LFLLKFFLRATKNRVPLYAALRCVSNKADADRLALLRFRWNLAPFRRVAATAQTTQPAARQCQNQWVFLPMGGLEAASIRQQVYPHGSPVPSYMNLIFGESPNVRTLCCCEGEASCP
jgi:hypothetical protein